jgi:hypothetical protein
MAWIHRTRWLRWKAPVALVLSLGCGNDGPDSSADDADASTSGMASGTTREPTGAVDSATSADSTGELPEETEHEETEHEGPELCGVTNSGDAPWFEVRHKGAELEDGATVRFECGGQGSFMFEFRVALGGFVPDSELVTFAITMSVDGFDVGPGNAFYMTHNYPVFVGCEEEFDGGLQSANYIRIFPPDEIADYAEMDGAAVSMSFTMMVDGQEIPFEITGTLDAAEDRSWGCCYDFEQCF